MTHSPTSLTKALLDAGWVRVRMKRHQIWRCPCGLHQVAFPLTPSDRRSVRNTAGDIRNTGCPYLPDLTRVR